MIVYLITFELRAICFELSECLVFGRSSQVKDSSPKQIAGILQRTGQIKVAEI